MDARAARTSRHVSVSFLGAVVATVAIAAAACGPSGSGHDGTRTPSTPGSSATSPTGTAGGPQPPTQGTETATKPPVPRTRDAMKPIAASTMEAELREIGLDPRDLPPLNKLEPAMLRKVMKPFAKALGVQCSHCHDTKSFKAPTPNKKIATHMWNDFTRGLALQDGALFCDSCHGGKAAFLDRSEAPVLSAYMKDNYVGQLVRTDKKENSCATCHGEPFEGKILTKLWK